MLLEFDLENDWKSLRIPTFSFLQLSIWRVQLSNLYLYLCIIYYSIIEAKFMPLKFFRKANDQPVDLPVVINRFLSRAMRKRRPPPACDHAGACVRCVHVRASARLQRQASNHAGACVPAWHTNASTVHPAIISPLSPLTSLCGFCFFLISEEFMNNLIYISLM